MPVTLPCCIDIVFMNPEKKREYIDLVKTCTSARDNIMMNMMKLRKND